MYKHCVKFCVHINARSQYSDGVNVQHFNCKSILVGCYAFFL